MGESSLPLSLSLYLSRSVRRHTLHCENLNLIEIYSWPSTRSAMEIVVESAGLSKSIYVWYSHVSSGPKGARGNYPWKLLFAVTCCNQQPLLISRCSLRLHFGQRFGSDSQSLSVTITFRNNDTLFDGDLWSVLFRFITECCYISCRNVFPAASR